MKVSPILTLLLLALPLALLGCQRSSTDGEQAKHGNLERAIAEYNEAVLQNPQNPEAYNNRGDVYHQLGEYERAIDDFDEAIRLDPQYADAYSYRGYAFYDLGEYERAIDNYDEAIRLDPQIASSYKLRGDVYHQLGEYERAIDDFDEAIRLDPQYVKAYNNRGWAFYELGDYQKAIEDYDEALRSDRQFALASLVYNNRGNAYSELAEFQRAIEDYNKALRLDPNDAWGYNNRGGAYYQLGEYQRAIDDFDDAIRLDPELAYNLDSIRDSSYRKIKEYQQTRGGAVDTELSREISQGWKVSRSAVAELRESDFPNRYTCIMGYGSWDYVPYELVNRKFEAVEIVKGQWTPNCQSSVLDSTPAEEVERQTSMHGRDSQCYEGLIHVRWDRETQKMDRFKLNWTEIIWGC